VTSAGEISRENYLWLQQHIQRTSGIVLDDNKHYLLEARLIPIVRREELRNLNDLCALLRATAPGPLVHAVRDAMTTNETLFFRDAVPFKAMQETLIPELLRDRPIFPRLSFWSAAASSGQEAYSLAMMLLDMGIEAAGFDILATDISSRMLEQAAAGRYSQLEVSRGLPARQLVRYFRREGAEWLVKDDLRRLVRFQAFDLRDPMEALGRFDFVLCRNVLIYFDQETKKQILGRMAATLSSEGHLLLGAAETTLNLTESFERHVVGSASFYRRRP
jgi:chemotaxis protein methyltransferase CheR